MILYRNRLVLDHDRDESLFWEMVQKNGRNYPYSKIIKLVGKR